MSDHLQTLQKLIAAWKRKDVDEVLSYFAEDIVWYYAAPALPPIRGKASAAQLLRRLCADMHDIDWRITHHAVSGDRLFVEGADTYRTTDGGQMALPYAGVLEFRDGLICGWRDYVDLEVIRNQKAGAPPPAGALELLAMSRGG